MKDKWMPEEISMWFINMRKKYGNKRNKIKSNKIKFMTIKQAVAYSVKKYKKLYLMLE